MAASINCLLVLMPAVMMSAYSQNICAPNLEPDSKFCAQISDSCTNPLITNVCQRHCGLCIDSGDTFTNSPGSFTDFPVDPDCQDTSKICAQFVDRCGFQKIRADCRKTCGLCGVPPVTPTTTTKTETPTSTSMSSKAGTSTTVASISSTMPSEGTKSSTVAATPTTEISTVDKVTTIQLTTIDKKTEQLINAAIILKYISNTKIQAEIRLKGRIDRAVVVDISSEVLDLLRQLRKPVKRVEVSDVEDYRTDSDTPITVAYMDIFLTSNGQETLNDLNSDSSAFKDQLRKTFNFKYTKDLYQGLYGGELPGPQTLPLVNTNETSTRRSDWWVHEYWYVILIVVLAFVILLIGAIIVPIALDRRRHRGIKIIDNGLSHTRV